MDENSHGGSRQVTQSKRRSRPAGQASREQENCHHQTFSDQTNDPRSWSANTRSDVPWLSKKSVDYWKKASGADSQGDSLRNGNVSTPRSVDDLLLLDTEEDANNAERTAIAAVNAMSLTSDNNQENASTSTIYSYDQFGGEEDENGLIPAGSSMTMAVQEEYDDR